MRSLLLLLSLISTQHSFGPTVRAYQASPADREPYVLFSADQDAGKPWKLHRLSSWGDERRHCGRVGTDWID